MPHPTQRPGPRFRVELRGATILLIATAVTPPLEAHYVLSADEAGSIASQLEDAIRVAAGINPRSGEPI